MQLLYLGAGLLYQGKMIKHLRETNMGYFEHMIFALKAVFFNLIVIIALILHAFFPFTFTTTYSKFIYRTKEILDGRNL